MGSAERRERERQEVRTAILDAARDIMGERGYDGLTMRGVADRIEYTAAAIYKHFADREELVRELCANDFYAFAQVLRARPGVTDRDAKDPYAALRAIAHGYVEFAVSHPQQYRVMFMTPKPIEDDLSRKGYPEGDAYATVLEVVRDAQARGCFPGLDPDLVAQTAWATVHGVVSLEIVHMCAKKKAVDFLPFQARVDAALEGTILGLEALARAKRPRTNARRGAAPASRRKRTRPPL